MEIKKCFQPIEVTTHNLQFHETPNITSLDFHNNYVFTSGQDRAVRLWEVILTDKNTYYKSNCYKTAENSSIKLKFSCEFTFFNDPVNIVRTYKNTKDEDIIFVAGTETGSIWYVRISKEKVNEIFSGSEKPFIKKLTKIDGNGCIDLCFLEETKVAAVFLSGEIKIIEIKEKRQNKENLLDTQTLVEKNESVSDEQKENEFVETPQVKEVKVFKAWNDKNDYKANILYWKKIHEGIIQGISFCSKTNVIVTKALDNQLKIFQIVNNILVHKDTVKKEMDKTHGANKRILVNKKKVYNFIRKNKLHVYEIAESESSNENENGLKLSAEYGPFNAPLVKVMKEGLFLVIVTKKSVYILYKDKKVAYVDNVAFREITDAFISKGIIFYCAQDGFLGSIRLNMESTKNI